MPFKILPNESPGPGIRRIIVEQLDRAINALQDVRLESPEVTHEVRKRCKKIRAVLRLIRPSHESVYERENVWMRDTARILSTARDADVLLETFDSLLQDCGPSVGSDWLAALRGRLASAADLERTGCRGNGVEHQLDTVRSRLLAAKKRVEAHDFEGVDPQDIYSGMGRTYRRARRALRCALKKDTAESRHTLRKRAKYLRYQTKVLVNTWPAMLRAMNREARRLSDGLGEDRDLELLRLRLQQEQALFKGYGEWKALLSLIDCRSDELRRCAFVSAKRLLTEKPSRFRKRMSAYWQDWGGRSRSVGEPTAPRTTRSGIGNCSDRLQEIELKGI